MSALISPSRLSLTGRLLLTICVALLMAGAFLVVVSAQRDAEQARGDLARELRQELEVLPQLIAETVVVGDYATLQRTLDRYVKTTLVSQVEFRDAHGVAVGSIDRPLPRLAPDWFLAVFDVARQSGGARLLVGGRDYGEIVITLDATELANRAWARLKLQGGALALAFIAASFGLWWGVRAGLAPLRRLEEAAAGLAGGRLDARIPVAGPPELQRLALAFNHMADELAGMHAELAESEQHFRLALEAAGMAAWHWDCASGRLTWGENPERLLGPRPDGGYPDFPSQVLADERSAFVAAGRAAAAHGDHYATDFRLRRTDGDVRWIAARGRVERDAGGAALGIRGVSVDITERKRAEEELIRYRQHLEDLVAERTIDLTVAKEMAEAASRSKSTFLANMSHEIRTPLNAVIGLTHLLLRQSPSPAQKEKLDKISGAARHLLEVLNDILDLSKIEAGRLSLEQRAFAPMPLLAAAGALVAERIAEKGLHYELDCEPLPAVLVGDATRLSQALLNLLGNAVKFTERGGIALCVRRQGESEAGMLLRFEVRDTGVGISADKLARIFEAFEQADSSTTREYGGSGLGLAIVRHIARLMGGEVGVDSQPGTGSTFWFTAAFGLSDADDRPPSLLPPPGEALEDRLRAGFSRHRLLLAEDDPVNREVALELLRECAGLRVDVAADGAEAARLAEATRYDLILMDMQMPVMDGIEATHAIRALPGHAATPILAMTANAFADDRQRCLDAGMSDHVAKPVDPDHLFSALLRWLSVQPRSSRQDLPNVGD